MKKAIKIYIVLSLICTFILTFVAAFKFIQKANYSGFGIGALVCGAFTFGILLIYSRYPEKEL